MANKKKNTLKSGVIQFKICGEIDNRKATFYLCAKSLFSMTWKPHFLSTNCHMW